jgi:hypothetical protein
VRLKKPNNSLAMLAAMTPSAISATIDSRIMTMQSTTQTTAQIKLILSVTYSPRLPNNVTAAHK